MGHIQDLRMERAKREFKNEIFPTDVNRSFYVDYAGNAMGFTIEREGGQILSYNVDSGRYETFGLDIRPQDGAVNMPPYDYKDGKIVDLLSEDPIKNIQKYTCFYARYFCGDFNSIITEEEYRHLEETEELYTHETLSYEPIFDGKIYPTLAESSATQIEAFGFHFNDDRRKVPSRAELSVTGKKREQHRPLSEAIKDAEKRTGETDVSGSEDKDIAKSHTKHKAEKEK